MLCLYKKLRFYWLHSRGYFLRGYFLLGTLSFISLLNSSSADALPPKHRVDLASAYTKIDVGDWQMLNAAYSYTVHKPFKALESSSITSGLAGRVLRREFRALHQTTYL